MQHIPPLTLVTSAFYFGKTNPNARSLETTIEYMTPLLSIPCYLAIFCDEDLYPRIKDLRESYGLNTLTHYIVTPFESIWTYQWKDTVIKNREAYWPTRDPRAGYESHLICSNKFTFVKQIAELNPFHTSKFGWIDGNIGNNGSKISEFYENNMLLNILQSVGDKFRIQILNVVNKSYTKPEQKREYYNQYRWLVCGCLFTFSLSPINMKILERLNQIFIQTTEAGYGHGEEMYYLEVLDEFYYDIERAYGDYKHILHNFIEPTRGHDYIYNNIIKKFLNMGYHRECYDAAKALISVYETYKTPINYRLYVSALFDMYVASFYYCRHNSRPILDKIRGLCESNGYFKKEYEKNKDFYESQFKFIN